MKKKVVLINQSTGYLMIDIANAYTDTYDEVVLMAGSIKVTERPLNEKVIVKRITAYNRKSSLKRLFTWGFASLQVFFRLLLKYRRYEIVYVTNPPMAYLSSLLLKNPFSLIVYDIYPNALRSIGIGDSSWCYKLWIKWNKKLFAKAKKIITLSEGMADCLASYVDKGRITVIPNWASKTSFHPIPKEENPFVKKHGLEDKFTVLYSGNMGFTHKVETIVEVAKLFHRDERVRFLFIGDGKMKADLLEVCRQYNLNNCMFLDWQPADTIQYSLASADLAVITLNDETAKVSVPSKTYNLIAVGAPLLCIVPKESELASMVSLYKNGASFLPEQINEIAAFIRRIASDEQIKEVMVENSISASMNYTYANAKLYV